MAHQTRPTAHPETTFGPPILPMLAKRAEAIPSGTGWIFEPKWDGFRVIVRRQGADLELQSREGHALNRYFPEVVATLLATLPKTCTLDGEIVVARNGGLDFDALQSRVHPAASRVLRLARELPASIVFWDVLALGARALLPLPFEERRTILQRLLRSAEAPIHLSPSTTDRELAVDWFDRFEGAGFDGVMAKRADGAYESGKRVMVKVKHERECDCVVGGFRWQKDSEEGAVGSLLLGLYDEDGALQHVGAVSSFPAAMRVELARKLAPLRRRVATHPWLAAGGDDRTRRPGQISRWSKGKNPAWCAVRPELVVEVGFDHLQGNRFRHLAQLRRWRPDKAAAACTYAQLEVVPPAELRRIFDA